MKSEWPCPVCEFMLDFEPWRGTSASDEICPSCGIQFGYDDARPELRAEVYAAWREAWLKNDRKKLLFQGLAPWSKQ